MRPRVEAIGKCKVYSLLTELVTRTAIVARKTPPRSVSLCPSSLPAPLSCPLKLVGKPRSPRHSSHLFACSHGFCRAQDRAVRPSVPGEKKERKPTPSKIKEPTRPCETARNSPYHKLHLCADKHSQTRLSKPFTDATDTLCCRSRTRQRTATLATTSSTSESVESCVLSSISLSLPLSQPVA